LLHIKEARANNTIPAGLSRKNAGLPDGLKRKRGKRKTKLIRPWNRWLSFLL